MNTALLTRMPQLVGATISCKFVNISCKFDR